MLFLTGPTWLKRDAALVNPRLHVPSTPRARIFCGKKASSGLGRGFECGQGHRRTMVCPLCVNRRCAGTFPTSCRLRPAVERRVSPERPPYSTGQEGVAGTSWPIFGAGSAARTCNAAIGTPDTFTISVRIGDSKPARLRTWLHLDQRSVQSRRASLYAFVRRSRAVLNL
jgi:hypothetical protein